MRDLDAGPATGPAKAGDASMVGRGVLVGPRIRRRSKPRSPGRKRHRWHRGLDRQLLSPEPSQDYRPCLPRTHDALTVGALSVGHAGAHDGTSLDPLRTAARAAVRGSKTPPACRSKYNNNTSPVQERHRSDSSIICVAEYLELLCRKCYRKHLDPAVTV